MRNCADCGKEMNVQDSYREYLSRTRYRAITVYECPDCGNVFEQKGSETIV